MTDPNVVVFDLDHTLVNSPLDLPAMGREMEAFLHAQGFPLPVREQRWSAPEQIDFVRKAAAHLEADLMRIPHTHETAAMEHAVLEPFAHETLATIRADGLATSIWTNNNRTVADFVLERLGLAPYFDLVVTRDDVRSIKPDPEGLRLVRARWPAAERMVVVGDAWIEGAAAAMLGVPFVAYRANRAAMERRGVTPDRWIESLAELPPIVADLLRS